MQTNVMYYNYHAMAKRLLKSGNCIGVSIFKRYKHIYPALVLYFDNHAPIPIRQYRWNEYLPLIDELGLNILNNDNIPPN